jgi:DNA-directed RNA polymerase subunit M/transcription elongation factor TFIIS
MDEYIDIIEMHLQKISLDTGEEVEWLKTQVYEDIGSETDLEKIEDYIKTVLETNKLGWNHKCFDQVRKGQQEQDDFILNPFEVEEGVVECKKCGSWKVYSVSVQTRAADEPMTTMAHCTICKTKWSYNG